MKVINFLFIFFLLIFVSCSTSEEFVRPNAQYQKYERIAVLPLNDHPNHKGSGELVADIVYTELLKQGIDVVDRASTVQILEEQNLGFSGVVDGRTAPKAGKLLGVNAILTGSVNDYGTTTQDIQIVQDASPAYMSFTKVGLTLKLIDVETGQMVWASTSSGTEIGDNVMTFAARKAVQDAIQKLAKHLKMQPTFQFSKKPSPKIGGVQTVGLPYYGNGYGVGVWTMIEEIRLRFSYLDMKTPEVFLLEGFTDGKFTAFSLSGDYFINKKSKGLWAGGGITSWNGSLSHEDVDERGDYQYVTFDFSTGYLHSVTEFFYIDLWLSLDFRLIGDATTMVGGREAVLDEVIPIGSIDVGFTF